MSKAPLGFCNEALTATAGYRLGNTALNIISIKCHTFSCVKHIDKGNTKLRADLITANL